MRADIAKALAGCGYGRADVGPIADAALDGVAAALADVDAPERGDCASSTATLYRLRAFEVAVVGGGADSVPRDAAVGHVMDATAPRPTRVALRGARRLLLPGGGEVVRLRFSMLSGMSKT